MLRWNAGSRTSPAPALIVTRDYVPNLKMILVPTRRINVYTAK
jgi:hypothetical protein